jgi:peptidoglycan/xylan/chitin deacetylase (PgdA/CDA1 family)
MGHAARLVAPSKAAAMNNTMRERVDASLRRSPVQPLFQWRASSRLIVLAYHGIGDPERFEEHLTYLRREMSPVSLDEVIGALGYGGGLPPRAVLISFDDGDRSLIEYGLPLLQEFGLPGVAFVVAGMLDDSGLLWWEEVGALLRTEGRVRELPAVLRRLKALPDDRRRSLMAEWRERSPQRPIPKEQLRTRELSVLESGGIRIGNHTLTHPCLTRCTQDVIEHEVREAHLILTAALGAPPQAFSYPNGDWDQRVLAVLRRYGYEVGFLFDHRVNQRSVAEPLTVSRVRVDSGTSLDRFRIIVSGFHPSLHGLRRRARI